MDGMERKVRAVLAKVAGKRRNTERMTGRTELNETNGSLLA
jgi:hypothetical protein